MSSNEKKGISEKILSIDPRFLYILLFLVIAIPLANPIGLPIGVSQYTKDTYNQIMSIPEDGKILVHMSTNPSDFADLGPSIKAVVKHLFSLPVKLLFVSFDDYDSVMMLNEYVLPEVKNLEDKIYGKDWIDLGYQIGKETSMTAFNKDIRSIISVDVHGTSLDEYEIMTEFNKVSDFDLAIVLGSGQIPQTLRQWITPSEIPLVATTLAVDTPEVIPFYGVGLVGILDGMPGGAEYEYLTGFLGDGVKNMDAMTAGHILVLSLVLIGNIITLSKKLGGSE